MRYGTEGHTLLHLRGCRPPQLNLLTTPSLGLLGLTKTDAIQYADQGIRVNAISAGLVRTPILSEEEWDAGRVILPREASQEAHD